MKTNLLFLLLISSQLLVAQISNDNLLAYYPFDNDLLDAGPNNFHGVGNGNTFGEDAQGNPDGALLLDGLDDFVDISAFGPQFRANLNQITIVFKIRFLKEIDGQEILSLGVSGESIETNIFQFEYENNRFQVETETGGDAINHELEVDQTESLLTGQWHRVMITINGDNLTYCKDGEVVFQGEYTPAETLTNSFFLGCFSRHFLTPKSFSSF